MDQFTAGTACFDMSPPPGVRLAGYPHFTRENTGVHDPLLAACLYLSDGKTEIAVVTLDILFFSKKYVGQVREKANRLCGLPGENLFICCSHTHSGPWAAGNPELSATAGDSDDISPEYMRFLTDGIANAAAEAKQNAFPASAGFGTGICGAEKGVGGNRRKKGGLCAPSVHVLAVRDVKETVRGVIVSYALHPTFLHEDNTLVSADYPGYVRDAVLERCPDAVVGFAQGASGDQSSRYFRKGQSFGEAERVGRLIGETAAQVIGGMTFEDSPSIRTAGAEVPFDIKVFPPLRGLRENVRRKTEEYERLKGEGAGYIEVQEANLRMLGAEDMLGYAVCMQKGRRIALLDDENPAEIRVIAVGRHFLVLLPGEIFTAFGLKIKNESAPGTVFVFELADGCLPGYCTDAEAAADESYESGNSMLTPEFGDKMADTALRLIKELS